MIKTFFTTRNEQVTGYGLRVSASGQRLIYGILNSVYAGLVITFISFAQVGATGTPYGGGTYDSSSYNGTSTSSAPAAGSTGGSANTASGSSASNTASKSSASASPSPSPASVATDQTNNYTAPATATTAHAARPASSKSTFLIGGIILVALAIAISIWLFARRRKTPDQTPWNNGQQQ